ncbi:MAG TPA: prepilin-type N-terminal cleavage/methylation domain-containing protein [Candidatus Sulfotelmatobacter sp.]|nr:prepilin-type N-terminal cleavage/methylation domain-containing protein [Candidatus Sulfotelmatobacter sp.]
MRKRNAFTLIELLMVIAIIAILAAILMPVLEQAKQRAWTGQCISNLRQIGMGMKMFADENGDMYPESGGDIYWNATDAAPPVGSGKQSWMQQIYQYTMNTNLYNCPGNVQLPPAMRGPFNYFNGARAAYIQMGADAPVNATAIRFPAEYVLSGDTCGIPNNTVGEGPGFTFDPNDADKDDYTQNCVGGPTNGTPYELWQVHLGGQNILFGDGHAQLYNRYVPTDMTFHYTVIASWGETNVN